MQHKGVGGSNPPWCTDAWAHICLRSLRRIYTSDNEKIFFGVVSDKQWTIFCDAFSLSYLLQNKEFQTNAERVLCRDAFIPRIRQMVLGRELSQVTTICERIGVPFAPILRPDQLFDDPHVTHPRATVEIKLSNGLRAMVPLLPVEYNGFRPGLHRGLRRLGSITMI